MRPIGNQGQLATFNFLSFRREVIFFLGDVFDEGKWCDDSEFRDVKRRFETMFATHQDQNVFVVAGNHNIGFHYAVTPRLNSRWDTKIRVTRWFE